jgi:hypothetical protein
MPASAPPQSSLTQTPIFLLLLEFFSFFFSKLLSKNKTKKKKKEKRKTRNDETSWFEWGEGEGSLGPRLPSLQRKSSPWGEQSWGSPSTPSLRLERGQSQWSKGQRG